jgi:WD40 repeat protein
MRYQVGGSLRGDDPTYVIRQADEQLYTELKTGDFCYVLNSRQMGKSSLLQRTSHRLEQEGYACVYLDVSRLGSEETTPVQWYKGIIISLLHALDLAQQINFEDWWRQQAELSLVQRLHQFVEEVLLPRVQQQRIFIFIDEIDSLLSLSFPVNDFFVWIRHCYNLRSHKSQFQRLGFAIFGVATPSDLISDKQRTPFNIGKAIELYGFQLHEAKPLVKGLEAVINQPEIVLREIIYWTKGQPFLTQKLCRLVVQVALESSRGRINLPAGTEVLWVEQLVRSRLIEHWESQDEPEHLRTIRDRLFFKEERTGRLLGLYQRVLQAEEKQALPIPTDDSREQTELLLSGLVEKRDGYLKIKNPIYRSVFNAQWVTQQLDALRPYSQALNAWVMSNYQDQSRLLRGRALQDAQKWAQGKSLGDVDYQFLAASQQEERREVQMALEAARAKEVEARLVQEKKTARWQRFLLVTVAIALLISTGLGIGTFIMYRQAVNSEYQARLSEVAALVSSSEGLFASNRKLDALVEAIKATQRLQKLKQANTNIEPQVKNVLRQAVYGADEYNRFCGHTAAVLTVAVSPDSSLIASAGIDKTIKLWRRDGTEVATLTDHQAAVRVLDFSFDGQMLVSASDDGVIKLWQRDQNGTYRISSSFTAHTAAIWGLAFSPDGQTIASASLDKTVKLWKRDGSLLNTFSDDNVGFSGVAFSPDGRVLAVATLYKAVKLWQQDGTNWDKANLLQTLVGHTGWVAAVAFSPDGQTIASSSEDTTIKLWRKDNTNGNYRFWKTLKGHSAGIWQVVFSADGQTMASASLDKTIKLWNIDGTELRTLRGHSASVWSVKFSRDASFIASAGAENVVRLWQTENLFQKSIIAHSAGIWSIAISPESGAIATAGHENIAKLWSNQGKLLKIISNGSPVFGVSFSRDGKLIALASEDDTVKLWQADGTLVATYKDPGIKLFTGAMSPNAQTIAMVNVDKTIRLWLRDRQAPVQEFRLLPKILKGHQAEIWQVVFSPDSRLLASASGDGTVKLWTLDGKLLRTLQGHTAAVWRVAFSPDGKIVASGSGDNTVKLWTLDGKLLRTLQGHTAAIWGVAFSPDSKIVATASVDTTIKLWQVDGTELTTLRGHTAAIRGVAISRDGKILASIGDDNTLILWNLQRILKQDVLAYGCALVQNYLQTNRTVKQSDRHLCKQI